jgi:shikimate dehydrogenase
VPDIDLYIDNTVRLHTTNAYAAIIGANPSQGARSPVLWNAAFRHQAIEAEMVPLDVRHANLEGLLTCLESDDRFVGGAVAVPHKQAVAALLARSGSDRLTAEAAAIGAVNCLFRNSSGTLSGTNTDGEGALKSLITVWPDFGSSSGLLIGLGGAGRAVAAYLAGALESPENLKISTRIVTEEKLDFVNKMGFRLVGWPPENEDIAGAGILVNCSVLGSRSRQSVRGEELTLDGFTPLAPIGERNRRRSLELLSEMDRDGMVFDIIYDPCPTTLLRLAEESGLRTLDGRGMNLEQAVVAFGYAVPGTDVAQTRRAMQHPDAEDGVLGS